MDINQTINQTACKSFSILMTDELCANYPEVFPDEESQKILKYFLPQMGSKEELSNYLNLLMKYHSNNPSSFSDTLGDEMVKYEVSLPKQGLVHLVLNYIASRDKEVPLISFLYGISIKELLEEYREFLEAIYQAYKKINNDLWAVNFIIETLNKK